MEPELEQWKAREVARLLALVETERRYYQEIVASIPVGLLILDPDLEIVSSNREVRRLFGLRAAEPLAGPLHQFLPDSVSAEVKAVIESGTPANILVAVPAEQDQQLRVQIRRIRNWDDNPRHEALLTIEEASEGGARGITARAETDAAAPPAVELLDSLDAIVWAAEIPSKRFLYVNEKGEELLGYPASKWLDSEDFWKERIHPEDRAAVLESYERSIGKWSRHSCEYRTIASYGKTIWLRETARLLHDGDGRARHLIGFAVDVTERRLLESLHVQAERIEAVSRFANQLSHQLANEVTIIGGYADEVVANLNANSALRSDLTEISQAAGRLRTLSSQLGSFFRIEPMEPGPVDVNALLKRMQLELAAALGEQGSCELHEFPASIGAWANEAQLQSALLTIAVHSSRQGAVRLRVECAPMEIEECFMPAAAGLEAGVYVVITVRAEDAAVDRAGVSSLETQAPSELAGIYRITRSWGGSVLGSHDPQTGAVYQIYLRRAGDRLVAPQPAPAETQLPVNAAVTEALETPDQEFVLLLEGDSAIRTLIRKMLQRQGYAVLETADGESAIHACEAHKGQVELLIADLELAQIAWPALMERLRQLCPRMKPLFFGTDAAPADAREWVASSGAMLLRKPFTIGTLLQRVKDLRGAPVAVV